MRDNFKIPKQHPKKDRFGGQVPFQKNYDKEDPLAGIGIDSKYQYSDDFKEDNFIIEKKNSYAPKIEKDPMVWDPPEDDNKYSKSKYLKKKSPL